MDALDENTRATGHALGTVPQETAHPQVFPGPELAIIIPTFNERGNVTELVTRLSTCLGGVRWEVIFVDDDSPDETAELVRSLGTMDRRVRCLQRIGRRGLSSACIEGMLASTAPYIAVMDGDLQHDEALLPQMYSALSRSGIDLVIGSRYVEGGGVGDWQLSRAFLSRLGVRLCRFVIPTELRDPMSGFFMLRRKAFEESVRQLSGLGFKILIDLFASAPRPLRWRELPYQFRPRHCGQSKLDTVVMWDYAMLLIDESIGHIVPARFVAFSIIGGLGFLVHLASVGLLLKAFDRPFVQAQGIATLTAMTFNYALNNALTYRDRRLKGWEWVRGWTAFLAVCSIGAVANVGIASYVYRWDSAWVPAAAAGVLVGAVWNYAATTVFTWTKPGRMAGRRRTRTLRKHVPAEPVNPL